MRVPGRRGSLACDRCGGLAALAVALSLLSCATAPRVPEPPPYEVNGCRPDAVESADGRRRLALLVGVGRYKSALIPTLSGPPGDLRRIYDLLTAPLGHGGYGFPRENVCVLADSAATVSGFRKAFEESLVRRARSGDTAFFYYSGHGSQVEDVNGDEWDTGKDSTLVLYDSRTGGVHDLVDDEIYELLQGLVAATHNVTAVIDSCHSGTIARGDPTPLVARAVPEERLTPEEKAALKEASRPTGTAFYHPKKLPGLVVLSAASDREPAYEIGGHGIFTDAVLEAFAALGSTPLTYEQAQHVIRARVAARSRQTPFFHGALDTIVLSADKRTQPFGLRVTSVGEVLVLSGPPVPGLGKGARLGIFDGASTGPEAAAPANAKATVTVEETSGLITTVRVAVPGPKDAKVKEGDLAILVLPAPRDIRLQVRLRKEGAPGGVPAARAAAIRQAVEGDAETKVLVSLVADDTTEAALELSLAADGHAQLRDEERRLRNEFDREGEAGLVARSLWQHARQRALQLIRPAPGGKLPEERVLSVTLVPETEAKQSKCARGQWIPGGPGKPYQAPLCWTYYTKVRNQGTASLLVSALAFTGDGGVQPLSDELNAPLGPGQELTLEPMDTAPPLDVADRIVVYGTMPDAPVPWHLLASPVDERAKIRGPGLARGEDAPLFQELDDFLSAGRGGERRKARPQDASWTRSTVEVVVRARGAFAEPPGAEDGAVPGRPTRREYTIPLDITPYLPPDPESFTYRLLREADRLAHRSIADGVPYKKHDWSAPSDDANLARGIDCSRAIWFAFRKSGLRYNDRGDAYLATGDMVGEKTAMRDQFERCDGKPYALGDVIVYRSDVKNDGHVVMVVDGANLIGWGSHGYDSHKGEGLPADTGVEYQKIKSSGDWGRWDRKDMELKACWRHRQLAAEAARFGDRPPELPLRNACDEALQCGRPAL